MSEITAARLLRDRALDFDDDARLTAEDGHTIDSIAYRTVAEILRAVADEFDGGS